MGALGEKLALGIDYQEAAIADQPSRIDCGRINREVAAGFHWVNVQGGHTEHDGDRLRASDRPASGQNIS
jgi:hypothetical protein